MDAASLLPLVENGVLLLALVLVYDVLVAPVQRQPGRWAEVVLGVSVGAIGMIVVLTPWQYAPGVMFDTRSVLFSISGLFFGVVPTFIAITMAIAVRLFQGGAGALTGVIVIAATGGMGIAWRAWRKPAPASLSWSELYLFGVAVHVVMLLCMFTLPQPLALSVLRAIALPVLVLYPIVTMLLGRLLVNRQRRELAVIAQQANEARYRSYVDNAPYGVFVVDETGRYLEANPAAYQIVGYSLAEILTMRILDLLPEAAQAAGLAHFQRLQAEGRAYSELPFRRKDGTVGWWSVAAVALSSTRYLGFVSDITVNRQNEAALRQSEQKATALLNAITDAAFLIDTEGHVLGLNSELTRRLGRSEDEIRNAYIYDLLPSENVALRRAEVQAAVQTRQPRRFRDLRGDAFIDNSIYPILDDNGEVVQLAVFGRDVTEQMKAEERYQTIFREMLDGFCPARDYL